MRSFQFSFSKQNDPLITTKQDVFIPTFRKSSSIFRVNKSCLQTSCFEWNRDGPYTRRRIRLRLTTVYVRANYLNRRCTQSVKWSRYSGWSALSAVRQFLSRKSEWRDRVDADRGWKKKEKKEELRINIQASSTFTLVPCSKQPRAREVAREREKKGEPRSSGPSTQHEAPFLSLLFTKLSLSSRENRNSVLQLSPSLFSSPWLVFVIPD